MVNLRVKVSVTISINPIRNAGLAGHDHGRDSVAAHGTGGGGAAMVVLPRPAMALGRLGVCVRARVRGIVRIGVRVRVRAREGSKF